MYEAATILAQNSNVKYIGLIVTGAKAFIVTLDTEHRQLEVAVSVFEGTECVSVKPYENLNGVVTDVEAIMIMKIFFPEHEWEEVKLWWTDPKIMLLKVELCMLTRKQG